MSHNERLKKPKPERQQPIRSWATLFGIPPNGADAARAGSVDGAASLQDVMSRSVDLGYRVVEEYIRRGQQAAQRINDQSYDAQAMTNDFQEAGVRMAQYASDFATLWLEMLQAATGNAARSPFNFGLGAWPMPTAATTAKSSTPSTVTPPPHDESAEHMRVRVEVVSRLPIEVALDLRPSAAVRPLVVHGLRAADPDKPRLTDVTLCAGSVDEPTRLRVCVPDDQPAGIYNGLIIDEETSRPVGTLSVRVSAA